MEILKRAKKLILWHEFDGPGDISIKVLEKICELYSETNNVNVIPVVKNIYEITAFFKSHPKDIDMPQMAFLPSDMVMFAYKGGFSAVPEDLYKDKIHENALKTMIFDGRQYGLPILGGNHLLLYYNKRIFPYGILYWEELDVMVQELQRKQVTPISLDTYQLYWILPVLSAFDAWPVKDQDPNNIDFTALKKAFCFIRSMMDKGILESYAASTEMLDKFFEGKVGAIIAGEWSFSYIMKKFGENTGVCRIPSIGGKCCTSVTSTLGLVYTGHSLESDYRASLLGFGEFLLGEKCQMMWINQVDRIPLNMKVGDKLIRYASDNKKVVLRQIHECHPLLVTGHSEKLWPVLEEGKELFWYGHIEIDETMRKMKEKINLLYCV